MATRSSSATVGTDQNGRPAVDFVLKSDGAQKFSDYTAGHVGSYFAITLDGAVVSAPVIQNAIPNGNVQITGGGLAGFNADGRDQPRDHPQVRLAAVPDHRPVEPDDQRHAGQPVPHPDGAGRPDRHRRWSSPSCSSTTGCPARCASFALIYYTLVMIAIFRLIPVTLTLAGIAGFVLSVGMAVDANILIFERMKEELRVGKSLPAAVEAGFNRAWNSILDSNVSSLITATILYALGSSVIRASPWS